ncbi:MAG: hypothetical protein ABJJ37_03945 [Roseibium sp.]
MQFIGVLAAAFILILFGATSSTSEAWKIASLEWPPYSGSKLDRNGTAIDELRSALKQLDIELEVDFMPWTRAKAVASSEEYVGYFPAWPEEVVSGFEPTRPISLSEVGIVQRAGVDIVWSDLLDLFNSYRIGFVRNYVYPDSIQELIDRHYGQDQGSENEHDLARTLAAGRIDIALTDPAVLFHVADELSLSGINPTPIILHKHPLVLAMNKREGYQRRLRRLNAVVTMKTLTPQMCCLLPEPGKPRL